MNNSKLIVLLLLAFPIGLVSRPAHAQDPSGTILITGCKSGSAVRGYKHPGGAIRAYAHFTCGSSVYVWNATAKTALVQQGSTVAYVASKYILGAGTNGQESPVAVRTFLQGIAEGLQLRDASASSARRQLVRSCLASRGCRVEAWSHLAWTRIKQPNQLIESPDSTLRLFAGGIYYSAFVVNPPVRFRDRPVPSVNSPVFVVDGGGLSLAIVNNACYTLGTDGKWAAAGASAVQSAAAMQ
ncbi:MAG: hypothetical protein DMG30_09175 [Acidobacteria bacterium]|nr:MAG: hypothetical protein DMG30_09175 [Acidobacteriota bacterium]